MTSSARIDFRNALLCAAITLAALLLAWPFANLPFNDDFTWSFTVKQLADTGHLVYNGWSSPSIIAQAYWGLLWVKLFGFSFNVLRFSTFPMAIGAVVVAYALARRAGLATPLAMFTALLLGLSPLFLPLAASFMTDVPGVFFLLLSLYFLVRGFESPARPAAIAWLIAGTIIALIGGSSRQTVWIVPLIVLPYFAWLRRKDRPFSITALANWVFIFAGALAMQSWFDRQPYALPDPPLRSYLSVGLHHPAHLAMGMTTVLLTMLLLILPAVAGTLRGPRGFRGTVPVVIFVVFVPFLVLRHHAIAPWMGNMLTPTGILGSVELSGDRPVVLVKSIRVALSLGVYIAGALLLASVFMSLARPRRAWDQLKSFFLHPANHGNIPAGLPLQRHASSVPQSAPIAIPAILLTILGYLALEITRCAFDVAYDRHLLPLIPLLAIPLLWLYQRSGHRQMPKAAWALLAVYAVFAIASTQDVLSLARARASAVQRLNASGIPNTQIEAGFEHDYWAELQTHGYINDPRLRNPAGAYKKGQSAIRSVQPLYRLEAAVTRATVATKFGSVAYFSFLPPFHRIVYIDRFTDPWWLDPQKAATRPSRLHQLIPKTLLQQYGD
jgi:hypothetical protein